MDIQARTPRIETKRLVLRMLGLDDFEDYAAMLADPSCFRFSERGPMTRDEAWVRLLRHVGHWALMGWGQFGLFEKTSGRFVGEAGLANFNRGFGPGWDELPEGGWSVAGWAQGQGYATEAMQAAIGWVEERLGSESMVCLIHAENAPSLRVAEKLGFRTTGETGYRGYKALLFERKRA
jgi:RimJ/RimL family protein N-acetyltransferase